MRIPGTAREDLKLAAYAYAIGFDIRGHLNADLRSAAGNGLFNDDGIPADSLQFVIGDMHVWDTARGWRSSRFLPGGTYEKPTDSDFYRKLKDALDEGARNWRDR